MNFNPGKRIKNTIKSVKKMVKGPSDDTRGDAAGQLLKRDVGVQRQAGGGQIKYTGQEEYMA